MKLTPKAYIITVIILVSTSIRLLLEFISELNFGRPEITGLEGGVGTIDI